MPALPPNAVPPVFEDWPLPYVDRLQARAMEAIDLVVLHCTELPDLAMARAFGERVLYGDGTGNSGHYYIDRDGRVLQFVPPTRAAHHTRGYNPRSIGIELVNTGRYPDWLDSRRQVMHEAYPEVQIAALLRLLDDLVQRCPALRTIAGHEDLDTAQEPASDDASILVFRKRDPGPMFPWARVLAALPLQRVP